MYCVLPIVSECTHAVCASYSGNVLFCSSLDLTFTREVLITIMTPTLEFIDNGFEKEIACPLKIII